MSTIWRGLSLLLRFLLVLIFIAVCGSVWIFARALPDYKGHASVASLTGQVQIVRDEHGVPHIFAPTMEDAARALGYVHASERLFQMEMQRRAGQGRLSEAVGADTLGIDRYVRTLGLYSLAQSSVKALSPDAQAYMQAYADGVNAWLDGHHAALPPEFMFLGITPEPWQPADSLVWGKLMGLDLSKNYKLEILRALLATHLTDMQMDAIFKTDAPSPVTTRPTHIGLTVGSTADDPYHQLASFIGLDQPASNEWVVGGAHTQSGKPLLANDPHLGLEAPVLWYLVRIVTPKLSIKGATVPGLPVVLLGQNDHIAWGLTTTGSDTQDLFLETIDPSNAENYMTPDGPKPFSVHDEVIHVKGERDVTIKVRTTRHGPVLSDIEPDLAQMAGKTKVVALAFTGLGDRDTTSEALIKVNRATNWQSFLEALKLYQTPAQNMVYADVEGHIGFFNPGLVPVRKAGNGTLPVEGASGLFDWTGTIPFNDLPQSFDPPAGFIFNANNPVAGPDYKYNLGNDWEEPWRAERLQQFFDQTPQHSVESSAMMQADHLSLAAKQLLPYLLAQKPTDTRALEAIEMLREWDGTMDKDRPEPLIFEAWLYRMHELLLVKESGTTLKDKGPFAASSIDFIMSHHGLDWCVIPDCTNTTSRALNEALAMLVQRDGEDMHLWRWGKEHVARLHNKFWEHVPGFSIWAKLDVPSSGDFYTLDRGGSGTVDPEDPFARTHGGGYRGIYDLSDPAQSRFMIATGQSGQIFSRHYGDLVQDWNNVKSFPLTGTESELTARGLPELVLSPL